MDYKWTNPSFLSLYIVSSMPSIIYCTEYPYVWTRYVCISKYDTFLKVEFLGNKAWTYWRDGLIITVTRKSVKPGLESLLTPWSWSFYLTFLHFSFCIYKMRIIITFTGILWCLSKMVQSGTIPYCWLIVSSKSM